MWEQKLRTVIVARGRKTRRRLAPIGRFAAVVLLASAYPVLGQTFTRVADTQTPVPGGSGTFTIFADGRAIEGGKIAFIGYDSGSGSGIYSYQDGVLSVVADTHTAVPGTADIFTDFFDVAIDGARVAFTAGWPGPGGGCSFSGSEGLFVRRIQGGSIRAMATSLSTDEQCFEGVEFQQGKLAVTAGVNPVDVYHNHSESIVAIQGIDRAKVLLDTMTPKPGGGSFIGYDQDISSRGGGLLFSEILRNTIGAVAGIYTFHNDGQGPQLVADKTTAIPGGSGHFSNFAGTDWDGGEIAFVGRDARSAFLYAGTSPADVRVVVNGSTPVPGEGVNFAGVANPIAYQGGVFVFEGFWGGPSEFGLFTSENGVLQAVLKQGDILDGRTVNDAFCEQGNKDGNQLLILVLFQDGTQGLYLVDL